MPECRKHPGVWTLWQVHDEGSLEGTYANYCPACQQWCDGCPEKGKESGVSEDDSH